MFVSSKCYSTCVFTCYKVCTLASCCTAAIYHSPNANNPSPACATRQANETKENKRNTKGGKETECASDAHAKEHTRFYQNEDALT